LRYLLTSLLTWARQEEDKKQTGRRAVTLRPVTNASGNLFL